MSCIILLLFLLAITSATRQEPLPILDSEWNFGATSRRATLHNDSSDTQAFLDEPAARKKNYQSKNILPTKEELTAGPAPIKRIFLRRMRKAGSTTVFGFLLAIMKDYSSSPAVARSSNITFDRMEYSSLNLGCLFGSAPLLTKPYGTVFLVTHLREPLSRINSEYWFAGPGKTIGVANESLWAEWIALSRPLPGGGALRITSMGAGFNAGIYFDNYYTRMLTGACGNCAVGKKLDPATGFGPVTGCSSHTKAFPFVNVTREKFYTAVDILEHYFDAVLILEWFRRPSLNAWLQATLERQLGLPRGSLKRHTLGHMRIGSNTANAKLKTEASPIY